MKLTNKKVLIILTLVIIAGVIAMMFLFTGRNRGFIIVNPYAGVNWDTFGQYKAALHVHTTHSDGLDPLPDMVFTHYHRGFDIVAITDHNVITRDWYRGLVGINLSRTLTADEVLAITAGTFPSDTRPQATGMIYFTYTNEQSRTEHINTFSAEFDNIPHPRFTQATTLEEVENLGGFSFLNHKGRYTGGVRGGEEGIAASNDPERIDYYVELYENFESLLGMELFNKLDDETRSDRILWDNLLMRLMPYGRFIWGFGADDSHSVEAVGYAWTVLLMPELTEAAARTAMEDGASISVSRVYRKLDINVTMPDGSPIPDAGTHATAFMLSQPTPSIVNITAENNQISITALDYDKIEWIVDGEVIHTGAILYLPNHRRHINSYVRARIISDTGVALTQPFGIQR